MAETVGFIGLGAMGAEMDTFTGKFPWTGRVRSAGDGCDPCGRDDGGGQSEVGGMKTKKPVRDGLHRDRSVQLSSVNGYRSGFHGAALR